MRLLTLILCSVTALFSLPALAYIDPGSGSTIMSAIAGLVVAITITIKSYWYKIRSFFVSTKNKTEDKSPEKKPE